MDEFKKVPPKKIKLILLLQFYFHHHQKSSIFFLVLTKVSLTSAGQMSWTNSKVFQLKSNYTNLTSKHIKLDII